MTDQLPNDPFGRVTKPAAARQHANPAGNWRDAAGSEDLHPTPNAVAVEALLLLQRIASQLDLLPRAIASAVKAEIPKKELAAADRRLLARLLPPALGDLGHRPYVARARDLLDQLRLQSAETKAAEVLREVEGVPDPVKAVGRLLLRADGHSIGGILIERDGVQRGATVYRFSRL